MRALQGAVVEQGMTRSHHGIVGDIKEFELESCWEALEAEGGRQVAEKGVSRDPVNKQWPQCPPVWTHSCTCAGSDEW